MLVSSQPPLARSRSRASRWAPLMLTLAPALLAVTLFAHGPLDQLIASATEAIKKDPNNPHLYIRRGEFHRLHRDWEAAWNDYATAWRLDSTLTVIHYVRGLLMADSGRHEEALDHLDRFLQHEPKHPDAHIARARTLVRLQRLLEAVQDYTRAIGLLETPAPEIFMERARALVAVGGTGHLRQALEGLNEGIERLGPVVTLNLYAVELETRLGRFDDALARLDRLAARAPRKARWLWRRGNVLVQAGRSAEARQAYTLALEEIEGLTRKTRALQRLETQLRNALQEIQ